MALTLETALAMARAGLAAPRSDPPRPVAIAVCDGAGHPLVLLREAEAPPLLAHIAEAKAFTCAAYGKPTRRVMDWAKDAPAWFEGVGHVAMARMGLPLIGALGGVIARGADGRLVGAVGVAGEAGPVDEAMALAAIAAAGLVPEAG